MLSPRRLRRHVTLVFVLTLVVRFLAFRFYDDHFDHLSLAVQLLDGELPARDFVDLGRPLKYVISAVGQAATGRTLIGEALLVSGFLAAAAAMTCWAAARAAGSLRLGWFAAALVVGIFSREYGYPRVLLPAVGLWLLWRYVERPRWRHVLELSVFTVLAFLIRHDNGVFFAAASGVTFVGRAWPAGVAAGRHLVGYGVVCLVLVGPYLGYLGATGELTSGTTPGIGALIDAVTVSAPRIEPFPPRRCPTDC